jgi:hypothetical protein
MRYAAMVMRSGVTVDVLRKSADWRRPRRYVSYSEECFAYHAEVDRVTDSDRDNVTYVGVPQFDEFVGSSSTQVDSRRILLIDHMLHNSGILGWDLAYRLQWVRELARVISELDLSLCIKTHPGDRSGVWDPYLSDRRFRLISMPELIELSGSASTVLGICSTLQLPLTGLPHTAAITLEIHPHPGHQLSDRIVQSGAALAVHTFSELTDALRGRSELAQMQQTSKPEFVRRFLYKLDGRAGERLRDALLHETTP